MAAAYMRVGVRQEGGAFKGSDFTEEGPPPPLVVVPAELRLVRLYCLRIRMVSVGPPWPYTWFEMSFCCWSCSC